MTKLQLPSKLPVNEFDSVTGNVNHVGSSPWPSDYGDLRLRLRTEKGKDYALWKPSSSPILECHQVVGYHCFVEGSSELSAFER